MGAVREIAASTSRDAFGPIALRELSGLVRSEVSSLDEFDPTAGSVVFVAEPENFPFHLTGPRRWPRWRLSNR